MNQSRGAFTAQISRKRKEREDFFLPSFSGNINSKKNHHYQVIKGKQVQPLSSFPKTTSSVPKPSESTPVPVRSNRLLAGYMAHEFLTKGTLMGQIFDPIKKTTPPPTPEPKMKTYAEVSTLLKTDGTHIAGVFNPTHLARWIEK